MLAAMGHRGGDGVAIVALHGAALGATTKRTRPAEDPADPFDRHPRGEISVVDGFIPGSAVARLASGRLVEEYDSNTEDERTALVTEFAVATWDPGRCTLHLARDAMGVKPLYYARHRDGWLVASELSALCKTDFGASIDVATFAQLLVEEHHEVAHSTLEHAKPVPPGIALSLGPMAPRSTRVFRPELSRASRSPDPEGRRLRTLLRASVGARLTSVGPVAVLVSGGLDSGVVAACAVEQARVLGTPPPVLVTTSYPGLPCDELSRSSALAAHLGVQLEVFEAPRDLSVYAPSATPLHHGYDPTFVLYRGMLERVRARDVRVFLTGMGSDELQWRTGLELIDACSGGLGELIDELGSGEWSARRAFRSVVAGMLRSRGLLRHSTEAPSPSWLRPRGRMLLEARRLERTARLSSLAELPPARRAWIASLLDGPQLPHGIATIGQLGAQLGVELRHPYLDGRIVRYFLERASVDRAHPRLYKLMLRAAAEEWLPTSYTATRRPVPFSAFFHPILQRLTESVHRASALEALELVEGLDLREMLEREPAPLREAYAIVSAELQLRAWKEALV